MSLAKEGGIKKRHLGIIGLITVMMQYGVGAKNEKLTRDSMRVVAVQEIAKVQQQVNTIRDERDRDFARKRDMTAILARIDQKMDRVEDNIGKLTVKVSRAEGFLRSISRGGYSIQESAWTRTR